MFQVVLCNIYTTMHTHPHDVAHVVGTVLAGMPVPPPAVGPHRYSLKGELVIVPPRSNGPPAADGTVLLLSELLGERSPEQ